MSKVLFDSMKWLLFPFPPPAKARLRSLSLSGREILGRSV